jgi:hypothetical protein
VRARDWAGADYYRELGVAPTATRDEITAAFRARARVLHPDTGPADPAAEERFVRAATAYRVLTGPLREEYDRAWRRGHLRSAVHGAPAHSRPHAQHRPWRLSRRGARGALWGGLALVVGGLVAAAVVVGLQVRDARLRDEGIAADAVVVREAGAPWLEFRTATGELVRTGIPDAKSGGVSAGDTVEIRYDPHDPRRVVKATHATARDITLWIMAVKLVVVGAVLVVIGARQRSRPKSAFRT